MKTLIIIPTYNECENIAQIIPAISKAQPLVDILVVDDNSPDGTARVVETMRAAQSQAGERPSLHLLLRPGKQGLGKAYISGMKWGIENGYDILVEMDADFSHRPEDLASLLNGLTQGDFAVGSRYVEGGGTVNWGLMRKIISRGGGIYSRMILGFPLNDWTGGFNAWKKEVLLGINLDTVKSEGYSFQIELKYKALKKGFKGVEAPITFEDRRVGQSKMSLKIVLEAFYRVWGLRYHT